MNNKEFDMMWAEDHEKAVAFYEAFMYDRDNIHNCENCPENYENRFSGNPCGQENCWVSAHCDATESDDYDGDDYDGDSWDLEVGFDPYEGCYTFDC